MNLGKEIEKHFRAVFFGGNWTAVNLKDSLTNISLQDATTSIHHLNSIASLVFHIHYYVSAVLKVLEGQPLIASDKFSFDLPTLNTEKEWELLVDKLLSDAELFAVEIGKLDEARLLEDFTDPKYGNYYRNLHGIIEHTHYHLGQISLIKKILIGTKTEISVL